MKGFQILGFRGAGVSDLALEACFYEIFRCVPFCGDLGP